MSSPKAIAGRGKYYFFGLVLFLAAQTALAQKNILISDSLEANAEMLKVKMGSQVMGRVWKLKFGDYAIVSGKSGWARSTSTSNFFGTRTSSRSAQKFSFVLVRQGGDTANVDAATNTVLQTRNAFQLSKHFSFGDDELMKQSISFSANISLSSDTAGSWLLVMLAEQGSQTTGKYKAFVTDGSRRIQIIPVSSDRPGEHALFPALGYELIENGRSWCALQYMGSGAFGLNHNIIWLDKALEPRMKMILSASLAAILEFKLLGPGQMD